VLSSHFLERMWAGLYTPDSDYEAAADVRAMRHEDVRIVDANADAHSPSDDSRT